MPQIITVFCCVGNEQVFNVRLGASLKGHEAEFRLIKKSASGSLAQVYNSINIADINTKFIMFVHEDVYFYDKEWIKKAVEYCNRCHNLGVAGVAGRTVSASRVGHVDHWGSRGIPKRRGYGNPVYDGRIVLVQTLDGQCLIVPTEVFKKYRFNEEFPFHMMAEDYCLTLRYVYGLHVYVIPLHVWHNNLGLSGKTGSLRRWHRKLQDKWHKKLKDVGIHITSTDSLTLDETFYCPICGGDLQLTPIGWICRVCKQPMLQRR